MTEETNGTTPTKQWISKNLVTLGSAAVLSVYSAGYFRTREAADRFANESVQRHAAAPASLSSNRPDEKETDARIRPAPTRNDIEGRDQQKHVVIKPSSAPVAAAKASEPVADAKAPAPSAPVATSADSAPTPAPAPKPAAAAIDSAPKEPEKKEERAGWRDGTFYGWGTSRHGDIQAAVDIKNGKIIAAYISQCLTRYSCSWISMLPGQIVSRQSAECDYVSGATQSSNAFYYAITEALGKAK